MATIEGGQSAGERQGSRGLTVSSTAGDRDSPTHDKLEVGRYNSDMSEPDDNLFSDDLAQGRQDEPWLKIEGLEWLDLSAATIGAGILGIIIGVLITVYSNPPKWLLTFLQFPGKVWVQALKMLVLPLICSLMILVPSKLRSQTEHMGRMGVMALKFYIATSAVGCMSGVIWVNIIRPGKNGSLEEDDLDDDAFDDGTATDDRTTWYDSILAIFENAVPPNIVDAMASLNILGVICVFLGTGLFLNMIHKDPQGQPYRRGADILKELAKTVLRVATMAMLYVIWFTPIGMFFLVMHKCASTNNLLNLLEALGLYVATALIAHFLHMFLFYPCLYWFVTGNTGGNGYIHFWRIKKAPMVAFATSSSAATLSISLRAADEGGCAPEVRNFVVPLGATVNMDGTGIGFPIMVMFIAQLYGINVNAGDQIAVMILSILCSIGTAPIPNVGMVYVVMLLQTVGHGLGDEDVVETAVATLFILDWFIDRVETAQNVNSDQFVARMITHLMDAQSDKKDTGWAGYLFG